MISSKTLFATAVVLAVVSGCQKPAPVPEGKVQVEVRAEPSAATLVYKGQPLGATPRTFRVASPDDLLDLQASIAPDSYVEKRIRLISEDRAEVIFIFGAGRSTTAKRLGLPRVLVFDFGAGMSFDVNQFAIKPPFLELLDRQARQLTTQFSALDVYVCGHTDNSGSADTNLPLSLNRAQSVADALTARGVSKARLKIQGLGSEFPAVANDTAENRAINRRTEIILPQ